MKTIHVNEITAAVKTLCIEANYYLPEDLYATLKKSQELEMSPVGKDILKDICVNADIAKQDHIPICQDTGTAVFFCEDWARGSY